MKIEFNDDQLVAILATYMLTHKASFSRQDAYMNAKILVTEAKHDFPTPKSKPKRTKKKGGGTVG